VLTARFELNDSMQFALSLSCKLRKLPKLNLTGANCLYATYSHSEEVQFEVIFNIYKKWLRCCATIRMVVGSIPDGVIGIFH